MVTGSFLQDQWYVAATSFELQAQPLGRKICNEDIVMFRRARLGTVGVLEDRCPHRKAPLSLGQLVNGRDPDARTTGFASTAPVVCTLDSEPEKPSRAGSTRDAIRRSSATT